MYQGPSRKWLMVLSIIGLVFVSISTLIAIIFFIIFPFLGIFALLDLILFVPIMVFFIITIIRVKNHQANKGSSITLIVLCSIGFLLALISTIVVFSVVAVLALLSSILGLIVGIGSLTSLKHFAHMPPAGPHVLPNPGYGQPAPAPQYHNPYQPAYQPPVSPTPVAPTGAKASMSNEQLKKELTDLKSLLDDGLITQEEFDKRKATLLG